MIYNITKEGKNFTICIANADKQVADIAQIINNGVSTWITTTEPNGLKRMFLLKAVRDEFQGKQYLIEYAILTLDGNNDSITSSHASFIAADEAEYDLFYSLVSQGYGDEVRKRVVNGLMNLVYGFYVFDPATGEVFAELIPQP